MSRTETELTGLQHLGSRATDYTYDYNPGLLETFPNKHPEADYMVTLLCPEFTSLCPKTGQPDYAKIIINYIPGERMVESKSLKLYLFSFRNTNTFHEESVNTILDAIVKLLKPRAAEVVGDFNPRGGIAIKVKATYGDRINE